MYLDSPGADFLSDFTGVEPGLGRLRQARQAGGFQVRGVDDQQPRRVKSGMHVRGHIGDAR
jgi:hypothetical protein